MSDGYVGRADDAMRFLPKHERVLGMVAADLAKKLAAGDITLAEYNDALREAAADAAVEAHQDAEP